MRANTLTHAACLDKIRPLALNQVAELINITYEDSEPRSFFHQMRVLAFPRVGKLPMNLRTPPCGTMVAQDIHGTNAKYRLQMPTFFIICLQYISPDLSRSLWPLFDIDSQLRGSPVHAAPIRPLKRLLLGVIFRGDRLQTCMSPRGDHMVTYVLTPIFYRLYEAALINSTI